MHVRKNDLVEVIAGDDAEKGRPRKVLRVLPDANKVVVEGVNRVYKHVKPSRRNPQGGRLSREMPIAASNVMIFCSRCRRGVRIQRYVDPNDGHKERRCRKCGNSLGMIRKPRQKKAPQA
jgi:large subunit ribosomal protein L24